MRETESKDEDGAGKLGEDGGREAREAEEEQWVFADAGPDFTLSANSKETKRGAHKRAEQK